MVAHLLFHSAVPLNFVSLVTSEPCQLVRLRVPFRVFQVFLGALSFVYFAKALTEGYLKSTITQIERRFDIPSSLVGVIDGSFEIGRYYRSPTFPLIPRSFSETCSVSSFIVC